MNERPIVRAWCPICGKACGSVYRVDEEYLWESLDRLNHAHLERRLTGYAGDLAEGWPTEWIDHPVRIWIRNNPGDTFHATCRAGHDLAADPGDLYAAALAGKRNITLRHAGHL